MRIELVVFDMAGTTVNDDDGVNRAVREALRHAGVSVTREAVNDVMGIPKPQALARLIEQSGQGEVMAKIETIYADFKDRMVHFYRADPSVHEIPGAAATFARLRAAGIKVALDTGFSRDIVDVILTRLHWNDQRLINATVSSDEVAHGRPASDMILKLMREVGVSDAKHVAKVGDTPSDIEEGINAGCSMIIGVTHGSHTANQLRRHAPTHLIGTVVELPDLLGVP